MLVHSKNKHINSGIFILWNIAEQLKSTHGVEQKKPDTKEEMLCDFNYMDKQST